MKFSTSDLDDIWEAAVNTNQNPFVRLFPDSIKKEVSEFKPDSVCTSFAFDELLIPGVTIDCPVYL